MTDKSNATKIYDVLSHEPFNYTHTQIIHCFETFIGTNVIGFDSARSRGRAKSKSRWEKPAEICAVMSTTIGDFERSSALLFSELWKSYPEGRPECDYICAEIAVSKMSKAMELNRLQRRRLKTIIERIRQHELKQVEYEWDDRMITSYLKLKKLI